MFHRFNVPFLEREIRFGKVVEHSMKLDVMQRYRLLTRDLFQSADLLKQEQF